MPHCPHLPTNDHPMDWRSLNAYGKERGADFYFTALQYGQALWLKGLSARSVLAVDRALFAHLEGNEEVLKQWPLPYRAISWLIANNPDDRFIGNPRVHYQHLADRVRGPLAEQKKWRAWACWYLTRQLKPELEADPKHDVSEPTLEAIEKGLSEYGIQNDLESFRESVRSLEKK